jgi:hypothetical protein
MDSEEGMVDRTGKRMRHTTIWHNMTVRERREGWRGRERAVRERL